MFGLESVQPVSYIDPWRLRFSERLRQLARGKFRVAYLYERPDNSTFRYRAYNMAQVLNEQPEDVSASYFFLGDLVHIEQIATLADVLVVCRVRYDDKVATLIGAFQRRGKRVLFDTDDLVFDSSYTHLLMNTLDVNTDEPAFWDHWFAYTSRMGATLRLRAAAHGNHSQFHEPRAAGDF